MDTVDESNFIVDRLTLIVYENSAGGLQHCCLTVISIEKLI